jgi:TolB-like protein
VISVLYFDNTTKNQEYDWLRKGLADMFITDISKSTQIQVVERENLEKVLNEQKLSLAGLTDEKTAIQVGKLLNVKKLIYGSYIILSNVIRLDTRITEVETGKIIRSLEGSGKLEEIFSVEKDLAEKILTHLRLKVPDELVVKETNSLDALKAYYEGLSLLDEGKAEKAIERFQKANEIDPLYQKPQKGLEGAYQFLKDFRNLRKQREIRNLYQKIDKLKTRLQAKKWKTYVDLIQEFNFASKSQEEIQKFNDENSVYLICNTPAQCTWHLMLTLYPELGMKYEEHFNDTKTKKKLCQESFQIAENSRSKFKDDSFLSEILYMQLHAILCLEDYNKLKTYAENFLLEYPDYRLIESAEDLYERALDSLKEQGG